MLKRALAYVDELKKKQIDSWNLYNKFYYGSEYNLSEIDVDTWNNEQWVCVNNKNEVVGYICVQPYQQLHIIKSITLISYTENLGDRTMLILDLQRLIHDYFYLYKYNAIRFGVYIGNPVEKFYDKFTASVGGKVCSYIRIFSKCVDGTTLSFKEYEILREEYTSHVSETGWNTLKLTNKEVEKTFEV